MEQRYPWSKDYEIDHGEIDAQHHQLLELANLLHIAVIQCTGERIDAVVAGTLAALESYVHHHFADEEALFERLGTPLLDEQRWEHAEIATELTRLRDEAGHMTPMRFAAMLEYWLDTRLVGHMTYSDRVAYLAGRAEAMRHPPRA